MDYKRLDKRFNRVLALVLTIAALAVGQSSAWAQSGLNEQQLLGTFNIDETRNLANSTISGFSFYEYTGSVIPIRYIVTALDGTVLEKGKDYNEEITLRNSTDVVTVQKEDVYTLHINGIMPYTGTQTADFTVQAQIPYIGGTCGTDVGWVVTDTNDDGSYETLTISGNGAMANFLDDNQPWAVFMSDITTAVIGEGVTSISNYFLSKFCKLTSVSIASSVTSIGKYAFFNTALTSFVIPASVESIGDNAFAHSSLEMVYFLGTTPPVPGSYVFDGCSQFTYIVVPAAAYDDYGFRDYKDLECGYAITCGEGISATTTNNGPLVEQSETVTLSYTGIVPDGYCVLYSYNDGSNDYAISGNTFTMPASNVTVSATLIPTSGTCGAEATDNVNWVVTDTNGDGTYETITISGNGAMADYYSNPVPWAAFKDVLTTVVIGDGVTSIGGNVFYQFTELTSVSIASSVTSIGTATFYECTKLATINGASGVTNVGSSAFDRTAWKNALLDGLTCVGHVAYKFKGDGTSVNLDDATTQIYKGCFQGSKITSVVIPASVESIEGYAFANSANLQKVYVLRHESNYPEIPLLSGGNAFDYCSNLTAIIVPADAYDDYKNSWSSYESKLKRGYTVTCGTGITATSYARIVAQGETVTLSYSGDVPTGCDVRYSIDGGTTLLAGKTFTMPDHNVTVTTAFPAKPTNTEAITYVDADGKTQTKAAGTVYILDGLEETLGQNVDDTWYIANSDLTYTTGLTLKGNVHLILADGKTMDVGKSNGRVNGYGIMTNGSDNLTIYGQSLGTGTISIYSRGSNSSGINANKLTINGGHVIADIDGSGSYALYTASTLTINGGIVEALASASSANAILAHEGFTYNGGVVTAIASNEATDEQEGTYKYYSICSAYGTYTFSWRNASDQITIGKTGLLIKEDTPTANFNRPFTDGTSLFIGTITDVDVIKSLANKTLRPACTAANPYEISSYAQLKDFAAIVNGTGDYSGFAYPNACAILKGDIVCKNAPGETDYDTNWTPIGNYDNEYTGTFDGRAPDGQVHTIIGLSTPANNSSSYVGLFGYVGSGGVVQNVKLEDANITGNSHVGGIVGRNCGVTENSVVSNSSITGQAYVGSIVGYNDGTIQNCAFIGTSIVRGSSNYTGGIVGYNNHIVKNSYVAISGSGSISSSISGWYYVGGIVGYLSGGKVENCHYSGSGKISANNYIGGIVGYSHNGIVLCCYYAGKGAISSNSQSYVGAIIGYNNGTTETEYCYYNKNNTSVTKAIGNAYETVTVKGLSATQFKNINNFSGFNIDEEVWLEGVVAPLLQGMPYTISFDANGGEGGMDDQTVTVTSENNAALSANTFTYSGYHFTGWNTQADGTGVPVATDVLAKLVGPETLYAQWECAHANMTAHAAVAATCTEAGNTAYWECSVCGKYFSDEGGTSEIDANSWVIDATGHRFTGDVCDYCHVVRIPYLDAGGDTQYCTDYTVLDNTMNNLAAGWYVVNSDIDYYASTLTFTGDAHLILCDGATLTVKNIDAATKLNIYAQSGNSGKMTVNANDNDTYGIYSYNEVNINGGTVSIENAKYGIYTYFYCDIKISGAKVFIDNTEHGIHTTNSDSGVKIYNATVEITAAKGDIPCAFYVNDKLTINNSTVKASATSTNDGVNIAAISAGSIDISGGKSYVEATASSPDSYINCGIYANLINITDATVLASAESTADGKDKGIGIYSNGDITINSGKVTANGDYIGIKSYDSNNGVDGNITLGWTNFGDYIYASSYEGTVKVADGKVLTDGTGATYDGTLTSDEITALAGKTLTKGMSWADLKTALEAGGTRTVMLTNNVTRDIVESITVTGTVTLDLNGYTIDGNSPDYNCILCVPNGVSLTITDSQTGGNLCKAGNHPTISVSEGGTLTLEAGTINAQTVGVNVSGSFNMTGGTLTGATDYGVYLDDNASFTMTGGIITGNAVGVDVNSANATFTVSGNVNITGNTKNSITKDVNLKYSDSNFNPIRIGGALNEAARIGINIEDDAANVITGDVVKVITNGLKVKGTKQNFVLNGRDGHALVTNTDGELTIAKIYSLTVPENVTVSGYTAEPDATNGCVVYKVPSGDVATINYTGAANSGKSVRYYAYNGTFTYLGAVDAQGKCAEFTMPGSDMTITRDAKEQDFTFANITLKEEFVNSVSQGLNATLDGSSLATISIPKPIPVSEVRLNRTFTPGKPATIMLPFDYTCNGSEGGTFYKFVGVEEENGQWIATMSEVQEPVNKVATLTANTPYLVMPSATSLTFNGGATLNTTGGGGLQTADEGSNWTFKGTYNYMKWTTDTSDPDYTAEREAEIGKAYGFAGVQRTDLNVEVGDFVKVASGAKIRPMGCYLLWSDTPYGLLAPSRGMNRAASTEELPDRITVRLIGADGVLTGIGEIDTRTGEITFDADSWYTLDGIRLNGKPVQSGIYINNGKKVSIKYGE